MEFSSVCGPVLSPRMATMTSPLRPTTLADTLYPLVLQVATAVSAMVSAIAAEISLRATNWAFAAPARPQANATASEIPAVRNAVLDMNSSPQITAAPWRAVERSFQLFGLMVSGGLLQIGGHLVD